MFGFFRRKEQKNAQPVICARADHCISRKNIDPDALKVLYRLSGLGYVAYLVGGGVRDLLLGRKPKDFDVGTSAKPNEVKRAFRNCFLIGRRFRLAHVRFGQKVIETATFRQNSQTVGEIIEHAAEGPLEDNTFGTPETDAYRRDFTVNGLFYNIKDFSVIDYVGGLKDLKKRLIRSIGDPMIRFREDPVRMMRAIKFSARLDFAIERKTEKAIRSLAQDGEGNPLAPFVYPYGVRAATLRGVVPAVFIRHVREGVPHALELRPHGRPIAGPGEVHRLRRR